MTHCLVVDDNRVVRRIARKILQDLGFKTSEAQDGQIALDACRTSMPDAILLDWDMPNMTGIEFLVTLRREAGGDKPIIVFCTVKNDLTFIRQAIEAGANEYIMKPFDKEILESKFARVGLVAS